MPTVPVQKYYSLTVVERGLMVYPLLKGRIPPHSLHLQGQIACTVQFSSVAQSCLTLQPHGLQHARPLSITNSRNLLKLMSIESVMPSNHLILCCPRLLLPSIFPSIRVFSNESALHIRWAKYWSFSFSISPSNECSGLISLRMDWNTS